MLKKGDIVIISAVVCLIILTSFFAISGGGKGKAVTVKRDREIIYSGTVYQEKRIDTGKNTVEIKNGEVKMLSADCKNQDCVKHKPISEKGESIICLPNKIIVEIGA